MAEVDHNWLDYTINNNTAGVMNVLAGYGYVGFLQPQTMSQVKEACEELIYKYGDDAVMALLQAHPEYDAFEELFLGNTPSHPKYNNALSDFTSRIENAVAKLRPIDQALVAIGVFVAVHYITQNWK